MKDIPRIIEDLKQQRDAIERAIAALNEIVGTGSAAATAQAKPQSQGRKTAPRKRGGLTPEGRERLAAAMRKRWAAKRAAEGAATKKRSAKRA